MQNGERVADTWRVSECGRIATYRGKRPPSAAPGFREQVMAVFGKPENGLWYLGERAVLWAPTNPISHCFGGTVLIQWPTNLPLFFGFTWIPAFIILLT